VGESYKIMYRLFLAASLAIATPLFSENLPKLADPAIEKGELKWFQLTENQKQVMAVYGVPKITTHVGEEFIGWQFVFGEIGEEDYSHYLVFSNKSGTLVSVARNYDPERVVDAFFPPSETTTYSLPTANPGEPFRVRVHRLKNGNYLIAMGVSKPGELCGQILLTTEDALQVFQTGLYTALNRK
jgi:hypothetical protein